MDLEEAGAVLGTSVGNAETRKAAMLITLHERVPEYQSLVRQQREQRLKLAEAERRAELRPQRCRL